MVRKQIKQISKSVKINRNLSKDNDEYYIYDGLLSDTTIDLYNTRFTRQALQQCVEKINRSSREGMPLKVELEHLYTETNLFYWLFGDILSAKLTENDELYVEFGIKKIHPISSLINDMLANPYNFHDFVPSLSIVGSSSEYVEDYQNGLVTFNDCEIERMGVVQTAGNPNTYIQIARSFAKQPDAKFVDNLDKSSNKELITLIRSAINNNKTNGENKMNPDNKKVDPKLDSVENVEPNIEDVEVKDVEVKDVEVKDVEVKDVEVKDKQITISFTDEDDLQKQMNQILKDELKKLLGGYTSTLTETISTMNESLKKELSEIKRSVETVKNENKKLKESNLALKRSFDKVKIIDEKINKLSIERGKKNDMTNKKYEEVAKQIENQMKELNELRENVEFMKRTPSSGVSAAIQRNRQVQSQVVDNDPIFIQTADGETLTVSEWKEFDQKAINGELTHSERVIYEEIYGNLMKQQFASQNKNSDYPESTPIQDTQPVQEPKPVKPDVDYDAKFENLNNQIGKLAEIVGQLAAKPAAQVQSKPEEKPVEELETEEK